MRRPLFNVPNKPSRSASNVLSISVAALLALVACGPAVSPSATSVRGPSPSATSSIGASPSALARGPQASRGKVPLILFSRKLSEKDVRTFTIGIDGSQETELTDVHDCRGTWSPDGTTIAVPDAASSLVLSATVNADGTGYAVHALGPSTLN